MRSKLKVAALVLAMGLPVAANAQTTPPPGNQAAGTPPAAGQPAAPSPATPPAPGAEPMSAQMGPQMMQMMQMMQQMMPMMQQMMGGGGGMGAGPGGMMGGGMPMMPGGPGGPGMGMGMSGPGAMWGATPGAAGAAGEPMMFRHTEGVLAFYKAELRITEAQTPQWNAFADAVRSGAKAMRAAMQRAATQRAALTAPEQIERRVALLTAMLDAAKVTAGASKTLYAALNPEQRKLADSFMGEHMRAMRGMMP